MTPVNLLSNPIYYTSKADVSFDVTGENELEVYIETDRLTGEYTTEHDRDAYRQLFQNTVVMKQYAQGQPKTNEWIDTRLSVYTKRVKKESNPYSAIAFKEKETESFVCHVVAGGGEEKGQSELAYVALPEYWGKGYTKEATTSVVHHYLPKIKIDHKVNGQELKEVVLSVDPENIASVRIAVDLGMNCHKVEKRFGMERWHFNIPASKLGQLEI